MGCNDDLLTEEHLICTAASCTTNCLGPVVKVATAISIPQISSENLVRALTAMQSRIYQASMHIYTEREGVLSWDTPKLLLAFASGCTYVIARRPLKASCRNCRLSSRTSASSTGASRRYMTSLARSPSWTWP